MIEPTLYIFDDGRADHYGYLFDYMTIKYGDIPDQIAYSIACGLLLTLSSLELV